MYLYVGNVWYYWEAKRLHKTGRTKFCCKAVAKAWL